MHVWSGEAGEIARGVVDDATGRVTEAWTGPQVAWKMARGGAGAFGGKGSTRGPSGSGSARVFLLGLADWRRPLSLRNLDLLALLSFPSRCWFFNRGDIFTSVAARLPPAPVPPRAHGVDRLSRPRGVARRGRVVAGLGARRPRRSSSLGFRIGLNVDAPRT